MWEGQLGSGAKGPAIMKAVVTLKDSYGLEVAGAGVETAVAARTRSGLGCYRAQGLLMAPSLSRDAIESPLRAGRIPLEWPQASSRSLPRRAHRALRSNDASQRDTAPCRPESGGRS